MIMVMAVVAVAGMVMAVVADAYKNAIETEFFASGLKIGWREALLFFRVVVAKRPLRFCGAGVFLTHFSLVCRLNLHADT